MVSKSKSRVPISRDVETQVLVSSKRRCCLCYFLNDDKTSRKGQIAHLNRDPSNSDFSNLVYLCLNHHDDFDSKSSQSKNYTVEEVKYYRDRLYQEIDITQIASLPEETNDADVTFQIVDGTDQVIGQGAKRLDYTHQPWRLLLPVEGEPQLFAYKSRNRFDGICRIEQIKLEDGRTVIVCEQVDGNPGISVTNAMEEIALQVCEQFKIEPQNLVWIEHYDTWFSYVTKTDQWVWITFDKMPPETVDFQNPKGKIMTEEDWGELGFRPRKKRSKRGKYPTSLVVRK